MGFLILVFGVLPAVTYGTALSYLESERSSLQSQVSVLQLRIAEKKAEQLSLLTEESSSTVTNVVVPVHKKPVITALNL